jgi:hypothetical protein
MIERTFTNEQLIRFFESDQFKRPGGGDDPLLKLIRSEIELRIKGKNRFENDFLISKDDIISWACKPFDDGGLGLTEEFVTNQLSGLENH